MAVATHTSGASARATHQLGALAVGLDMIMPEVDRLSPMFIAERPDISPGLQRELAIAYQ